MKTRLEWYQSLRVIALLAVASWVVVVLLALAAALAVALGFATPPLLAAVRRLLRPVESAVRRLVVIAARDLVVPVLRRGPFPTEAIDHCLGILRERGSYAAPGFMKPEGVVVFHTAGNVGFKRTLDNDGMPKALAKARLAAADAA